MNARRRFNIVATSTLLILATATAAWAFWTAIGSGFGSSTAGTLAAPTGVTVPSSVSGSTVHVSWTAPTPPGSGAVSYYVQRFVGSTPSAACGTSPGSLITATSCDDTGVTSGTYSYKVTGVWRTWTAQSSASGSVTVQSDATPPTASITFPVNTTTYKATTYGAGCTPTGICGSASDATGVQSVKVSIKRSSDNTYWNGSTFTGTIETFNTTTLASPGVTSTNWNYAFSLPGDGSYTLHVQTADTLGNAQTGTTYAATAMFTIDTAAPSASGIDTTSGGATAGRPDSPDTIVYTFSEAMSASSIKAGWNGTSTAASVVITDNGASNDTLSITGVNIGTVNLGSTGWATAIITFSDSTMALSADGKTLTVTIGTTCTSSSSNCNAKLNTITSNTTLTWNPSVAATDVAGNGMSTTPRASSSKEQF